MKHTNITGKAIAPLTLLKIRSQLRELLCLFLQTASPLRLVFLIRGIPAPLTLLGLFLVCFVVGLFFFTSSFRFTAELRGRCRDFLRASLPPCVRSLPVNQRPHQSGTFGLSECVVCSILSFLNNICFWEHSYVCLLVAMCMLCYRAYL